MASLRLESISKVFAGGVRALSAVSLEAASGEIVVLQGPSGSGKTTLLRIAAGLESPTTGRVLIAGEDVTTQPAHLRRVGFAFQQPALWPHWNVRDNLAFGARLRAGVMGWRAIWSRWAPTTRAKQWRDKEERIQTQVEQVSRQLGIGSLLERRPETLSGGERQRVAIGRSIVSACRVLLLDEPFSSLEQTLRKELRTELRQWRDQYSLTVVYVTHDLADAEELGARLVMLHGGKIAV